MGGDKGHVDGNGVTPCSERVGAGDGDELIDGDGHVDRHAVACDAIARGDNNQEPAGVVWVYVKRRYDGLDNKAG